jgi:hypothetical protein
MTAENWPDSFNQFVAKVASADERLDQHHRRLVRSWTAQLLEVAHKSITALTGQTSIFEQQIRHKVNIAAFPPILQETEFESISGKRLPATDESILATIERFKVIEALPNIFKQYVDAIILSGSMSYGPFFNVRKYTTEHEAKLWNSDIDLVAKLRPGFDTKHNFTWNNNTDILEPSDSVAFLRRLQHFAALYRAGRAKVLTHRFELAEYDFSVSIHCIPSPVFKALFNDDLRTSLRTNTDQIYSLDDYKPVPFGRAITMERGFDGSKIPYYVPPQQSVENGVIARLSGFVLSNNRFYPGLYQSNVLPEFQIIYDDSGTATKIMTTYKTILLDRLAEERKVRPHSSLTSAHVRQQVLAPERYDFLGQRI